MTNDDRILDRVRKLLATAEHPNTPPPEAEAMSEKAAELMARYAIDHALLDQQSQRASSPETRNLHVRAPYPVPKSVLLANVGSAYRVRTVIGGISEGRLCTLVGFRADLEVTELLFTSLLLQATTAMLATAHGPEGLRAFRHAFLLGYASSIGRRLYSAQERTVAAETQASGRSAELVLASREAVVGRMVDELFPRLGRLRSTASDRRGVVAGNRAGDAADLSTGRNQVGERRGALAPGAS